MKGGKYQFLGQRKGTNPNTGSHVRPSFKRNRNEFEMVIEKPP